MRGRGIILSPYLDSEMVQAAHQADTCVPGPPYCTGTVLVLYYTVLYYTGTVLYCTCGLTCKSVTLNTAAPRLGGHTSPIMIVLGCMHALLLATANTELDGNGRTALQHGTAKAQGHFCGS